MSSPAVSWSKSFLTLTLTLQTTQVIQPGCILRLDGILCFKIILKLTPFLFFRNSLTAGVHVLQIRSKMGGYWAVKRHWWVKLYSCSVKCYINVLFNILFITSNLSCFYIDHERSTSSTLRCITTIKVNDSSFIDLFLMMTHCLYSHPSVRPSKSRWHIDNSWQLLSF